MVLDNYSNMSIDELGSSLLQKKDEDARKAAKRSKKNERIQQALAVLMLGQGVMKNQYKKRAKELEDLHKFEILNNENESKQIGVTSSIVSTIGNTWKDQGGDLDSRVNSFENSDDYGAFSQKVLPFIQQKIKAATGEEYDSMYNTSAYNNAVDLATKQFARQYLENNNYKNYETQLRSILDEKDLDRAELFERGMGLNSHTLTQYEKRNYQSVLAEARAQGNLMGGFKRVLGLFNDKYKSKGGFDIFSPATEADLAGPTMRDINQALNLKGMTNNIVDNALAEASKSPTRWRERGRSKAHTNLRNNVGDFQAGPIKEMVRLIDSGRYPSELEGTMTNITGQNVEDLIKELKDEPAQKEAFVLDVTALSLRLKEDRKFLQAVYQNTEGKKGKGRKSFAEFKQIMSDDSSRIQFSAMLAINEGFKDSEYFTIGDDVSYNSYGTLPAIYNSVGLANVLGDGINVAPNGELNLGNSYTQMNTEQKQTAIKNEADSILRSSTSDQERNVRLAALEDEVDVNFDQDMQSFLEDLATEKMADRFNTTKTSAINTGFQIGTNIAEKVKQTGKVFAESSEDLKENSKNLLNSISQSFKSGATNISEIVDTAAKNKIEKDRIVLESKIAGGQALANSAQVFYTDMSNFVTNATEDLKEDASAFANKLGDTLTKTSEGFSKSKQDLVDDIKKFFTIGNKEKSLLTPKSEVKDTTTIAQDLRNILPQNILTFAKYKIGNTIFKGKGQDIDVANFGTEQKEVLKTAMKNAVEDGRNYIKYSDYPSMANGKKVEDFYKGARAERNIIDLVKESFADPVFEMFTTTGVFTFEPLENNKFRIKPDKYDFDKSKSTKKQRENPQDSYAKLVFASQDISDSQTYNFFIQGII